MLTYRKAITHFWQSDKPNCGPIALQCLFDAPIEALEKIVKCKNGTSTENLYLGMKENGIECNHVILGGDHNSHLWWINQLSYRFPIYISCHFLVQGLRGRPSNDYHAILFANGLCYDGHNHREEPIAGIVQKFNKKFVIRDIVIFDHELPNWKNNLINNL